MPMLTFIYQKFMKFIFDLHNKDRFWKQKTIVKYAYNFKDVFHADLWRGHSSHLIIEVIGKPPELFEELPIDHKKISDKKTVLIMALFSPKPDAVVERCVSVSSNRKPTITCVYD